MAHPDIDTHLNPDAAQKDSAQVRLKHFRCIQFIGADAPRRIAKFISEYVNHATVIDEQGDLMDPTNYANLDVGLPAALLNTIYYSDGMWYLFFDHHAPYSAAAGDEWPFNALPNPSDTGYDL